MSPLDMALSPLGRMLRGRRAGDEHSVRRAPALAANQAIDFSTPAFAHGAGIPIRHAGAGRGPNISPALHWGPLPPATRQLLLVMEDIDVPVSRPVIHVIALFPPETGGFGEDELTPGNSSVRYVPARGGRTGYHGPRPLPGHGPHRYGFHLYALDEAIPHGTPVPGLEPLLGLMAGHVIAAGFFEGVQEG
jgi:phosphatidylethanolamine-binding protein (PEBP) family uncharacterized protein